MRLRRFTPLAAVMLAGCTATIDQSSFFPQDLPAPAATLAAPPGYRLEEAMIELPGLGLVHAARLDDPASEATLVFASGNGGFVSAHTERAAALARAAGTDIVLYDYPGRGGTTVAPTVDGSIAFGPAFLDALRARGWIGRGPLFLHGLSFGGSQAAAMARGGGVAGVIVENSAADIAAVGRNFVPALARPFVRLEVDPALARFDYLGYLVQAKAPVLLIVSEDDKIVRPRNMRDLAAQLRARGVEVTEVTVPGGHGTALLQPAALEAIRRFVAAHGGG